MRVFIADDSGDIRTSLRKRLSLIEGVEIVGDSETTTGATREIERLKPDFVILDLFMPGGGGIVTLKAIKKAKPPPKVIVFTNYSLPEYKKLCLAYGAERFYDKSTEFRELIATISQYQEIRFQ